MPRTTLDTTLSLLLSCTGLSPSLVCFSKTVLLDFVNQFCSRTPYVFLLMVWALSISLATTLEIDFSFFSYGYLDVSVPHVPFSYTTLLIYGYLVCFLLDEFPHSDIFGYIGYVLLPKLFAAYHVLLRLLVPRHSPYALSSLTFFFLDFKTFGFILAFLFVFC